MTSSTPPAPDQELPDPDVPHPDHELPHPDAPRPDHDLPRPGRPGDRPGQPDRPTPKK